MNSSSSRPLAVDKTVEGEGCNLAINFEDIYVRLKRGATTLFLSCSTHDKVGVLLKEVSKLMGKDKELIKIQKQAEKKQPTPGEEEEEEEDDEVKYIDLDPDRSVKSYSVPNSSILYFVYRKGEDEWEEVNIISGEDLEKKT
eukprot:jgi/Bigna1/140688/aug1.57_g15396